MPLNKKQITGSVRFGAVTAPVIRIKNHSGKEVGLFLTFLRNASHPQYRIMIFKAFPQLESLLEDVTDKNREERIVRQFVKNFYKDNSAAIKENVNRSKVILKRGAGAALNHLARLMDYQWPKNYLGYAAVPTILPFSPFRSRTFYFSILDDIHGQPKRDILFIAIHEISHMLLLDTLKKQYRQPPERIMGKIPLYFLKEILAPVIMNQPRLKNMLKTEGYLGNSLLRRLFVTLPKQDGKIQITKFFRRIYEQNKYDKKMGFQQTLDRMIKILSGIENTLSKKYDIWSRYGQELSAHPKILKEYSGVIKIKRGTII